MTVGEAKASADAVAGNLLVHSVPVLALFNFGASHCFISSNFVIDHLVPLDKLDNQWEISTGNGGDYH